MTTSRHVASTAARSALRRRPYRLAASLTLLPALLLSGATTANAQQPTHPHSDRPATQAALEDLVSTGTPGAIVRVDSGRRHWNGTAGVADLNRPAKRSSAEHFRIGSVTKAFTAVTLLRLEAQGYLSLDDSVAKWLPGVLDHNGYDGNNITIRQLLNHTSGVFDVLGDDDFRSRYTGRAFFDHRYDSWTPRRLVEIATSHRPLFEPGEGWSYSNTNYTLAGMIIEAATGHSYDDVVDTQILRPLRLGETVVPGDSATLPRPHARAYSYLFVDGPESKIYDVTEVNPSMAWAGGGMISTTRDLNVFFRQLMAGRLLPPRQQRELLTTVETGHGQQQYGLGVWTYDLPCGTFWGGDGDLFGSVTYTVSTADGSHLLTLNTNDNWNDDERAEEVLTTELCG